MRIFPLVVTLLLLATGAHAAAEDASIKELFKKFELVVDQHQTEHVEEVFSKKFLENNGGKAGFAKKVKSIPKETDKSKSILPGLTVQKGAHSETWYVQSKADAKSKEPAGASSYIVIKEDGKFKIEGTIEGD